MAAEARARLASFARDVPADESGTRVIIVGFGDDAEGDSSRARRLALARAIEARSVLLAGGIRSTRIDVRAMGKPTDGSDPDRVEVSLATSGGAAQR
jgi:outer membrane protein OmpA-like peptidoglycan-associated protein